MSMILDGSNGVTFNDASLQGAAASPYVLKNRIINGDMRIDQRNAGAEVTPTNGQYTIDRWVCFQSAASKYKFKQNAGAVTPPVGFTNYAGITSLSSYSVTSSDYNIFRQIIEGFNVDDLDWGTANAKTVTISFWVRSSLTGTFGGSLQNSAQNRNYPFTYTISVANTWEQKTITVAGDTSGTWLTTNGYGVTLNFGLGMGSTYSGTAGAWSANTYYSATGATSVVGTNGATFYITGVQLEVGTSATPFERRLYNQELANCQRYAQSAGGGFTGRVSTTTLSDMLGSFKVPMRASPTLTFGGFSGAVTLLTQAGIAVYTATSISGPSSTTNTFYTNVVSSGLTIGAISLAYADYIFASAEL